MAGNFSLPDLLLLIIAIVIALIGAVSAETVIRGYGIALLFLIVLFWVLYAIARKQGWVLKKTFPVIRSEKVSEIFLGLALFVSVIAISWYAGLSISRAFSDADGILAGLVIFGILALAFAAYREQRAP